MIQIIPADVTGLIDSSTLLLGKRSIRFNSSQKSQRLHAIQNLGSFSVWTATSNSVSTCFPRLAAELGPQKIGTKSRAAKSNRCD